MCLGSNNNLGDALSLHFPPAGNSSQIIYTLLLLQLNVGPNKPHSDPTWPVVNVSLSGCLLNMDPGLRFFFFFIGAFQFCFCFSQQNIIPLPMYNIDICLLRHRKKYLIYKRNLKKKEPFNFRLCVFR